MHGKSSRLAALTAATLLATASLASAGTEAASAEAKTERKVIVHKIPGGGDGLFSWRGTMLGVGFVSLTPELRVHFGAPEGAGVMVSKVVADSAAQAAGIEVGDIVLKVDGQAVGEEHGLHELISDRKAGDTVAIEVLRDGRQQTLNATLKESEHAPQMFERKIMAFCKDANGAEKDCPEPAFLGALDCGGDETCEVKVICKDEGSCTCTVNGEEKDCPAMAHPSPR
jgi:hypothetical protein